MKRKVFAFGKRIADCERKKTYPTRGAALISADHHTRIAVREYHCDVCGFWHLTKHPLASHGEGG